MRSTTALVLSLFATTTLLPAQGVLELHPATQVLVAVTATDALRATIGCHGS